MEKCSEDDGTSDNAFDKSNYECKFILSKHNFNISNSLNLLAALFYSYLFYNTLH